MKITAKSVVLFIIILVNCNYSISQISNDSGKTSDSNQDTTSGSLNINSAGLISVKPFANDFTIKNSSSSFIYGFNLDSVSYTITKATLVINFQNSIVTIPQLSYFTVSLNGNILSTRFADSPQPQNSSWQIDIPTTYLKNGYNSFNFFCWLRSSVDPCIDFYNSQDWLKIFSSSGLYLNRTVKPNLEIFNYPFPYFDDLKNYPLNSNLIIKDKNSPSVISAFLKLCSSLNNYISYDKQIKFPVNKQLFTNNINFGLKNDFPDLSSIQSEDSTGLISVTSNDKGGYNLNIAGNSNSAIDKSVYALSEKNTVNEMNVNPFAVTKMTNIQNVNLPVIPDEAANIKFSDIGIRDIKLGGLFESRSGIKITKPVGYKIGFGTKLNIKFSYSGNLNKNSSMLSVLVNTKFVGSKNFGISEKSIDSISVFIPQEELYKNSWQIEFLAYNDFDITKEECNKRFADEISTVIEDNSEFELQSGTIDYSPSLSSFPMALNSLNKSYTDVAFWFPSEPDDELLSIAASISYQAARKNGTYLNIKTYIGETLTEEIKNSSVIFLISGKYSDVYANFRENMILNPISDSQFSVKSGYNIPATNLTKTSVLEVFNSPFTSGVIYSIFTEKSSVMNLIHFINSEEINNLEAPISLINDKNITSTINNSKIFTDFKETDGFIIKYLRYIIFGIFFVVIFLIWYINKLKKRKKSA